MKKHFNKNFIMSKNKKNDFNQVTFSRFVKSSLMIDHCHVTGKFRDADHWSFNINLQLTKKVPVIFHNLRGYDSHLIFCELNKFDVKTNVTPNGLEKYMVFFWVKT